MLKILHLNNYMSYTSGVTRYIYNIIKNTSDFIDHEVICFNGDAIQLFKKNHINITSVKYRGVISIPFLYKFLVKYSQKRHFDIIHNHHRIFDSLTSFFPLSKIKSVTTVHSKVYGRIHLSYRADKIISVSNSITKHLITHHRVNSEKILHIKNCVNSNDIIIKVNTGELRRQLNLDDQKLILFAGRFSREKGVDILVQAFENLNRPINEVLLILIGEGEEEKQLKEFCKGHQLPVRFVSPVHNIFDYYNLADVVVLPSRVDPFPYVMLETGLMRKPFIGSNVDGIPELIKHKVNGVLFKSENVNELVSSFQMILDNKLFAQQIADNLYKDVNENYTAEKIIPEYINFYNSLV